MKKLFFSLLIFVLICGIMPAASAESIDLDGFTVTLPANFVAELKETEPGEGTEFFTAASAYQAESVYEMLTVQVGANSGLDAVFSEDFGFARREDLDLSLLTEDQLHAEAERFTAYLDSAFPVYMTYQSPKSIKADGRLGLVVTGYYTDYNNSLTGEFRAYEFYYLNKTIIIYYDTQIEGTYFNEAVFELSDGIVSDISFDMDPASQPMNAQRFSTAVSMAIPVLVTLAIALILGFLFGKIKRAPKPAETIEAAAPAEAAPVKPAPAETALAPQPKPPVKQPAPILADDTEEEAVDWQSMLAELKQEAANEPEAQASTEPEVPAPEAPQSKPDAPQEAKEKPEPDSEPQADNIDAGGDLKDNIESSFKEIGRLAAMIKEKLHLGKSEDETPAEKTAEPSEKISAEDTDYVSYLDKLLPKGRYKTQATQKAPLNPEPTEAPESAAVPAGPTNESKTAEPQNKPESRTAQPDIPAGSDQDKKEGNFISWALSRIVKRIETAEDEPDPNIPEFESRVEMHISEKTEKNPIDKLMPGLFGDDEPEEELIEIVLDEDADTLAELAEPGDDEILIQPDETPPKKRRRLSDLFSKKSGDDETP